MIAFLVLIKPESSFMYQLKAVWWSFHCYVICIILGHIDFCAVIYVNNKLRYVYKYFA